MPPLRVLVVVGALGVGGTENHLLQVLPRLAAHGIDIRVRALSGGGPIAGRLRAAGVAVTTPSDAPPPRALARRLVAGLRAWPSLLAMRRGWRPHVVHFFLSEPYLLGVWPFLGGTRIKRVMSRRSLNLYQRARPALARLEHWLHGRMDALVGNAQAVLADLVAEGVPRAKLELIRNGIDLSRFAPDDAARRAKRAALGLAADEVAVVCVANLIAYKGHADLVDAIAALPAGSATARVFCAGRDDGIGAALRARAEQAGVAAKFVWLGPHDDVPGLLAAADIAVLASHEEGFPNAAIEAMAAGLPLAATRAGGIPEAVVEGVTGLLVPPRDPAALAAALACLIGDPALRAELGKAGRARATAEFGVDSCVAAYAALYRALTASAGPKPGI